MPPVAPMLRWGPHRSLPCWAMPPQRSPFAFTATQRRGPVAFRPRAAPERAPVERSFDSGGGLVIVGIHGFGGSVSN